MTNQQLHDHIIDAQIEYGKTGDRSCFLCKLVKFTEKTKGNITLECDITGDCVPIYKKFEMFENK